ncbi:hypothetical protein C8Q79DRAFT_188690 [Trametes meyenii]|nr:hypothetical protein C8Q79DRAFT_188690 [Trametes meyenii]
MQATLRHNRRRSHGPRPAPGPRRKLTTTTWRFPPRPQVDRRQSRRSNPQRVILEPRRSINAPQASSFRPHTRPPSPKTSESNDARGPGPQSSRRARISCFEDVPRHGRDDDEIHGASAFSTLSLNFVSSTGGEVPPRTRRYSRNLPSPTRARGRAVGPRRSQCHRASWGVFADQGFTLAPAARSAHRTLRSKSQVAIPSPRTRETHRPWVFIPGTQISTRCRGWAPGTRAHLSSSCISPRPRRYTYWLRRPHRHKITGDSGTYRSVLSYADGQDSGCRTSHRRPALAAPAIFCAYGR